MSRHIDNVITTSARILYGLRTLRAHGMLQASLQLVFSTTALVKLYSVRSRLVGLCKLWWYQ